MFHIKYPHRKDFVTWEEFGCLCRALGLPPDLFKNRVGWDTFDIKYDESGLETKTILRIFELNLLKESLHRTYNMHTADWNASAITHAIRLLSSRVLTFDGVYKARVAYMTYEHPDMKGMLLNRHILLRTLKMAGLVIAPLKLMHRIKHTKASFEEPHRIQLHEFFDLILWCETDKGYSHQGLHNILGKDGVLFPLVDFQKLLSHHDQRVARQMNAQYLQEERYYGKESLGSKEIFKDPLVSYDFRTEQIYAYRDKYHHLKDEVSQSQKRVYRAHAGSIRQRPISAPDLDKYRWKADREKTVDTSAQAVYHLMQKRLHSAPTTEIQSHPQRPSTQVRSHTKPERAVTPVDLEELQIKIDDLHFDMNTLNTRREIQTENKMLFYIPRYLEKLADKKLDTEATRRKTWIQEPKRRKPHWTLQIINHLVNPPSNTATTHNRLCDARFHERAKKETRLASSSVPKLPVTDHSSIREKKSSNARQCYSSRAV